jgi:hypothetical protein
MGLAWGWHGVGMGLAWGSHGVGMGPNGVSTFPHGARPSQNPPKKQAGGGGRRAHWSGSVYAMRAVLRRQVLVAWPGAGELP